MKKYLLTLSIFCSLLIQGAFAAGDAKIRNCAYLGKTSTPYFADCVHQNFKTIDKVANLGLNKCLNFSQDKLSDSFQICLLSNFFTIGKAEHLDLTSCQNYSSGVSLIFVGCVQKNFQKIAKKFNMVYQ